MKNKLKLWIGLTVLCACTANAAIVSPQAYWSFEGDSGVYGYGSMANPAWAEKVSGTAPSYVGASTAPVWPEITTNGLKGAAFYATDPTKSGQKTMTMNWENSVKDIVSNVESYTVCGWINTRDAGKNGSDHYLVRNFVNGFSLKWRADGRLQFKDSVDGNWRYPAWNDHNSNGDWVFFGVTRDSGSIRFYVGSEANAVVVSGDPTTGLTLGATETSGRLIFGGYSYNGTDTYANFDMDELRIYSAATGDSGALTLSQLEEIRQFDLLPPPPPEVGPATIVGISFISSNIVELAVDIPNSGFHYTVQGNTDLGTAESWTNWPHSADGILPFVYTNLNYSSTDGTNTFVYVQASTNTAFFRIDGEVVP